MTEQSEWAIFYIVFAGTFFVVSLVITVLFLTIYAQKRALAARLELAALEKQKQKDVLKASIEGEEKERRRIALELHDDVGATLSLVNMMVRTSGLEKSESSEISTEIRKVITTVRRISHDLLPGTLNKFELEGAVADLCHRYSNDKLQLIFKNGSSTEKPQLPPETALIIYRVIQESVANAVKYANAKTIVIEFSQKIPKFTAIVSDNGKGFNPDRVNGGIGLKNMQGRLSAIDGKLEIDSTAGKGTKIKMEVCNP